MNIPLPSSKYAIKLDLPKIFAALGIEVKNIGLKVHGITQADSGAIVISQLICSFFDPDRPLSDQFSPEDIANLRIIHAFVPCIV